MTKRVLIAKFNFNIPTEELEIKMAAAAFKYSAIPGCCWKTWLINGDQKEAGGVYLFESATELEQYLNSNLFAAVLNNPAYGNFQINTFGVTEAASIITGAPLAKMNV